MQSEPLHLDIPITIAGMSFGALSAPAKEALGRGATAVGTSTTTGDGGMTPEEREHSKTLVYQLLPSRYGMNPDDLRRADAIEVVVGQGAKPGGGGMLLGQKISDRVAEMRDLPKGIDQRSACRHPDWTGPDDLEIKIQELREITDWQKPIFVKVGATRHVLRRRAGGQGGRGRGRARRDAGRDGRHAGGVHRARRHPDAGGDPAGGRGAAGARHAPPGAADRLGRDPLRRRRREGARARRGRGLDRRRGADRAGRQRARATTPTTREIGSAAGFYDDWQEGRDPAGISTQDDELAARFDAELGGRRLANYLRTMVLEMQTLARACGKSHLHNLEPEDLVALTLEASAMARVPLAGTSWIPGRLEDDRGVPVHEHRGPRSASATARASTVRSMSAPSADQRVDVVAVRDADHVLLDDRAGVELLGDVVGGRADQLDPALLGALVGPAPAKAGRNEWWMLMTGRADLPEELAGEDLHVAGQHDQVEAAARAARAAPPRPPPWCRG